ncbi:MAG: hypothetical protein QXZ13_01885, partial [Candidatus Diapherotrites archaeon]
MKEDNFSLFLTIAKQAKLEKEVYVSTSALSSITGYSQQSISRKLIEMEKEGLITRKTSNLGTLIKITEKGKKELILPENLKEELRKPLGKIFKSTGGVLNFIKLAKPVMTI